MCIVYLYNILTHFNFNYFVYTVDNIQYNQSKVLTEHPQLNYVRQFGRSVSETS